MHSAEIVGITGISRVLRPMAAVAAEHIVEVDFLGRESFLYCLIRCVLEVDVDGLLRQNSCRGRGRSDGDFGRDLLQSKVVAQTFPPCVSKKPKAISTL